MYKQVAKQTTWSNTKDVTEMAVWWLCVFFAQLQNSYERFLKNVTDISSSQESQQEDQNKFPLPKNISATEMEKSKILRQSVDLILI